MTQATTLCTLLLLVALLPSEVTSHTNSSSCPVHINGCSIPCGLPFVYKTKFTPACNKHDVCYSCVSIRLHYHTASMRPKMAIFSPDNPECSKPRGVSQQTIEHWVSLVVAYAYAVACHAGYGISKSISITINLFFLFLILPFMLMLARFHLT